MAENNVSQWNRQDQSFEGVDWEEESYREGCAYARERASVRLKELDDRYELVGKRMYGHASERMGFWEGASLEWGKHYDLGRVRLFVVGGDGANRMKRRGMSWTIRGAQRMVKAIQLDRNGELSGFCRNRADRCQRRTEPVPPSSRRLQTAPKTTVSDWVEATVPALNGPHSSRPWTHSLRNLIHGSHRLD